jgi:hypothetical protein
MDVDPDPGGPKTHGSDGSGSGSAIALCIRFDPVCFYEFLLVEVFCKVTVPFSVCRNVDKDTLFCEPYLKLRLQSVLWIWIWNSLGSRDWE